MDVYQERYLKHQARKKKQLMFSDGLLPPFPSAPKTVETAIAVRVSQRIFNKEKLEEDVLNTILQSATQAPSSCNRRGVLLKVVDHPEDKALLSGILVGGVGWIHRAQVIVLFLADKEAYKSPYEKDFMHYCDTGFIAQNMWLTATSLNVGAAYINPNIREDHGSIFQDHFGGDLVFCGALVLGYYDIKCSLSEKPRLSDIMV